MNKLFFEDNSSKWEEISEGLERKIIGYSDELMMVKVRVAKGTQVPMHHHPHVQSSCVISGKFELVLNDETKIIEAGDGFFAASNMLHQVLALEEGIIIDALSPAREDFLVKNK